MAALIGKLKPAHHEQQSAGLYLFNTILSPSQNNRLRFQQGKQRRLAVMPDWSAHCAQDTPKYTVSPTPVHDRRVYTSQPIKLRRWQIFKIAHNLLNSIYTLRIFFQQIRQTCHPMRKYCNLAARWPWTIRCHNLIVTLLYGAVTKCRCKHVCDQHYCYRFSSIGIATIDRSCNCSTFI